MPTPELSAVPSRADANATENTTRFSVVLSGHFTCHEAGDLPHCPSRKVATTTLGCCPSLGDACFMALGAMSRQRFVLDAQEGHANGFAFETASFRPSKVTVYDPSGHKVLIGAIGCWLRTLHWFEPALLSDEIRWLQEAARHLQHAADCQDRWGNACTALALRGQATDLLHHLVSPEWAALACEALKVAACTDERVKVTSIASSLAQAQQAFQVQYETPLSQRYFGAQPTAVQHGQQAFA